MVAIDHASGDELYRWGQDGFWSFDPPESLFDWQHGVTYTPDGNLLLSTHASTTSEEGVVREYVIDDEARALVEVWSFGVGDGINAYYLGEAHRLPGGNTLHNYGSTARIREATHEGEVVWDVEWVDERGNLCNLIGRSNPIEDLYALAP